MKQEEKIYDYLVIGSGFGGSVAALRLAEKGYSVLVVEQGKRWNNQDFPKTNWIIWKYLWIPFLRCFGFQRLTFTRHANILSGTGVGGGSLVYANTLRIPPSRFFNNEQWGRFNNWESTLKPFYEKASSMLGRTLNRSLNEEDHLLRGIAEEMGRGHTFEPVHVGVYFGDTKQDADPFFNGEGPLRRGCIECGGCMVGCRENAKNSLDKNYLWFAEKKGVEIRSGTRALRTDFSNEVYSTVLVTFTRFIKRKYLIRSRGLVVAGGALGTLNFLLKQKYKYHSLPNLSDQLGEELRTNSETLNAISLTGRKINNGVAISSSFAPDEDTSIEVVKYPDGSGAMKLFFGMATGPGNGLTRTLGMFRNIIMHPVNALRVAFNFNWAKNTVILLVMQSRDNAMKMIWKKNFFGGRMKMENKGAKKVPAYIEVGQEVMHRYAKKVNGVALNILPEIVYNGTTTAHILGGCPMGEDATKGVIGSNYEVHGYPRMFVVDGSAIQGNLGVNPSLTITACAEYAMDLVNEKK
ncbi:MAG: GMC family oxidoreductase [Bacteroidales bacterium]